MRLLVDLGGTNCRCALADRSGNILASKNYKNSNFDSFDEILKGFRSFCALEMKYAALSIAAPVLGSRVRMTNLPWEICASEIEQQLSLERAVLMNDFAAAALSLPYLKNDQLVEIKSGALQPDAPKALLGPGTGLGIGGLVHNGDQWQPVAGEGGHVTQAAISENQQQILAWLNRQSDHVSAERVNSGMGLENLYQAVQAVRNQRPVNTRTAEQITTSALSGDELAREALDLFYEFLAINTGNLALTLGAKGGIYLAGGILPRIRDDFLASGFVRYLLRKGRFASYLEEIPVFLLVDPYPAFIGMNAYLDRHSM